MSSAFRRNFLILWSDLLIALSAFWLARYFGDMPRWYWLVLSAVVWVVLGGVSRKLQFGAYKRIRYAFLGIFALDVLSGLFLCTLYRHCVPGYEYDYSIILATGIIIVLDWALYSLLTAPLTAFTQCSQDIPITLNTLTSFDIVIPPIFYCL